MLKNTNISVSKLSVIGAGQIGPDILLHFAKSFAKKNVELVLLDISESALINAQNKIEKKIKKGTEARVFSENQGLAMVSSIKYTMNYQDVAGSDIVIEAATESEPVKDKIFRQIEELTGNDCIYMSNSSHMQPEVIFRNIRNQSRCLVAHYFFPAEINPVVELVPSNDTDKGLVDRLLSFYESIGKVPVKVKSSYGYAIDPIFEGLCQTAILCLGRGWGNEKEIDAAAVKALGLGVGPFTALNLTGGNPITAHGLDEMGKLLLPWFKTPDTLHEKNKLNAAWNTALRGETVELSPEKEERLTREFKGAYFALASFILQKDIISIDDLNMACEMSLVIKPPFTLMNKTGIENSIQLVEGFCKNHSNFPVPEILYSAKNEGRWILQDIVTRIHDNVLLITIRRPKVLNALNLEVLNQIQRVMEKVVTDDTINSIVITGFGVKAFVSGADLNMLASLKTPEEGYKNSRAFQSVLNYIENYPKPVVCAINGFAFGGGNELAMACTTRICKKGLPVLVCQPEVNLGFIPGAGGTQRLPRIVGVEKAAEILRTGRNVSSQEAAEIGLVHSQADGDLIEAAVNLAHELASGTLQIIPIPKDPIDVVQIPEPLEIGHLSKKIDGLLVKSIYEGAGLTLEKGLDLESRMFGECLLSEDMKIGLENFKINGPKAKANFIHS
jgi:enoyl-CoA hydratase / 3-hydroxyacyl-CoA dehydrogenase